MLVAQDDRHEHWVLHHQRTKTEGGHREFVHSMYDWATAHGYEVKRPRRGDLICFEWDRDNWPDHVGIVVRVLALRWRSGHFVGWVRYVAGNDGNAVADRKRWMTARDRFCRVP